jgi:hypothetical protein
MNYLKKTLTVLTPFAFLLFLYSCTPKEAQPVDQPAKIDNTLKSVSLMQDSAGIDATAAFAGLKRVNLAIDSIGYPDAGYKMWEVVGEDSTGFKFMVEGYWPDKETYDLIHDHELYKEATDTEDANWDGLKTIWYHRFKKVK